MYNITLTGKLYAGKLQVSIIATKCHYYIVLTMIVQYDSEYSLRTQMLILN